MEKIKAKTMQCTVYYYKAKENFIFLYRYDNQSIHLSVRSKNFYQYISGDLRPWFCSEETEPISCILDPSHMIKLVRNTLADWAVLKNADGESIKWEYIEALHSVQVQ
jgi:hypothetical protein